MLLTLSQYNVIIQYIILCNITLMVVRILKCDKDDKLLGEGNCYDEIDPINHGG